MAIFLYSVECQRGRECAGPTKYWRVIRLRQQLSKIQLIRGRPGARAAAVARQCAQRYAWQRGGAGPVPRGGAGGGGGGGGVGGGGGAGGGRPAARAPGRPPGRTEGNRAGGRTAARRRHRCASAGPSRPPPPRPPPTPPPHRWTRPPPPAPSGRASERGAGFASGTAA